MLEAAITSTCGAYGIVICVNQWWHADRTAYCRGCRSLQLPAMLNINARLPPCGTQCIVLVSVGGALLLLGFVAGALGQAAALGNVAWVA